MKFLKYLNVNSNIGSHIFIVLSRWECYINGIVLKFSHFWNFQISGRETHQKSKILKWPNVSYFVLDFLKASTYIQRMPGILEIYFKLNNKLILWNLNLGSTG